MVSVITQSVWFKQGLFSHYNTALTQDSLGRLKTEGKKGPRLAQIQHQNKTKQTEIDPEPAQTRPDQRTQTRTEKISPGPEAVGTSIAK